jgi:hypothetical protein
LANQLAIFAQTTASGLQKFNRNIVCARIKLTESVETSKSSEPEKPANDYLRTGLPDGLFSNQKYKFG